MTTDCRVCYGPCDMEIHQASLRVRETFAARLVAKLAPMPIIQNKPKPPKKRRAS